MNLKMITAVAAASVLAISSSAMANGRVNHVNHVKHGKAGTSTMIAGIGIGYNRVNKDLKDYRFTGDVHGEYDYNVNNDIFVGAKVAVGKTADLEKYSLHGNAVVGYNICPTTVIYINGGLAGAKFNHFKFVQGYEGGFGVRTKVSSNVYAGAAFDHITFRKKGISRMPSDNTLKLTIDYAY